MTSGWRQRKRNEEKNHVPYSLRHALCAWLVRHGAAAVKSYPRIRIFGLPPFPHKKARIEAFRQGLRELGYMEGKNIAIELRSAEGKFDRLPALAAEIVRLKVEVIVTGGPAATRAAKEATVTIPIVMTQDTDPVGNGSSSA